MKTVRTDRFFARAEKYLGVGHTKFGELWDTYVPVEGQAIPPSFKGKLHADLLSKLA